MDDILKYAIDNGIIDLSYVQDKVEMNKRKEYLERHPYKIWEGKDKKWFTYLPDAEKGRCLKKRNTRKEIEDLVIEYYKKEEMKPCFRAVYKQWIAERQEFDEVGKSSITRYENDFERFFPNDEPFCKIRLCEVTNSDLEKFIKRTIKNKKLTAKSYAGLRLLLNGVFKFAKREGYTNYSIATFFNDLSLPSNIFVKKVKNNDNEVFTEEEVQRLFRYFRENLSIVHLGLMLQFLTGLRVGELSTLKPEDNRKPMVLKVSRTEIYYKNSDGIKTWEIKEFPKTENSIRNIILPELAQKILDVLKNMSKDHEYIFYDKERRMTGRVFNYHLKKACREIGIPPRSTHKIRKTYASLLLANDIDEAVVMKQLGHKNISTTHNYYHYDITNDKEKMEAINKIVCYE